MLRMKGTEVLKVTNGIVRVVYDPVTDSCSIGLRTNETLEWKHISKDLHDMLVKELADQQGKS